MRYRRVPSPCWQAPLVPAHGASDSLGTGTAEAGDQGSLPSSLLVYLEWFKVSGLDAWPFWAQISWEKWHHQSVDQSIHKAPVSIRMTHPKYKAQQHPTSPQCQYGSTKLTHVIWSAWPFWQKWLVLFPERGNWGSGKLWPVQGYRELGHGRSPLSSGFQWLPGKLSSFINASQSQHLVLPLCSKIFHLVLIVCQALCQGGGVKWIKLTM